MAPIKKQKVKKPSKGKIQEKKDQDLDRSVVSGQLQKKINKMQEKEQKGVVFIKNLPHGFFEEQLKKYFEQFGNVTRVRLARSTRTGNSKGYAFVEFEYPEVAEVAAETMDNYLMFKHIVKASYIPPEKQQFNYFRSSVKKIRNKSGKLVWVSGKTASLQHKVKKHNDWSDEIFQKRTQKQLKKLQKIGEKYAHLGIDVNELVVQPKIFTEKKKLKTTTENKNKSTSDAASLSKRNTRGSKNSVSLEDLLGNTIQEDTDDEDYIAMRESEGGESGDSSNEETYGFAKSSNSEDTEDDDENDSVEDKKPIVRGISNKPKSSLKSSNVGRSAEISKRKPHTGGITKKNKKRSKQPLAENKTSLKITAAKELAKPLSKVKAKLSGPLKNKKSLLKSK